MTFKSFWSRTWAAVTAPPTDPLTDESHWITGGFMPQDTTAGTKVDPVRSMALSAYYAAIRNISEDIGKLPFDVFDRATINGKPGKEKAIDDPVYALLHKQPNPEMGAMVFRETMNAYALGWGNGLAEIQFNGNKEPIALWPIHPSRVQVKRNARREVVYEVRADDNRKVRLRKERMLHVKGLGDGLWGYSVAQIGAESMGLSLAQQKFGSSFFSNGAHIGGVLSHPERLSPEAHETLRRSWSSQYSGPGKAFKPAILEEGMKWENIRIPLRDAQFIEARGFQVEEIARWFRVPPHKLQDLNHATCSNIEQQSLEYVGDTITPWAVRWEQECDWKLLFNDTQRYCKLNLTALLRADSAARAAFYHSMQEMGDMNRDEVRDREDLNPIEGGENFYMMSNLALVNPDGTLALPEGDDGEPNGVDPPQDEPPAPPPPEDDAEDAAVPVAVVQRMRPVLLDAAARMTRKEVRAAANAAKKDE